MMNSKKITALLLISCLIFFPSCQKDIKKMTVTTGISTNVLSNTAVVSGTIIDLGEGANKYGHCYSTIANPTVDGTKKEMANPDLGDFTSNLSDLIPNTTYYAKAYLARGNEVVYGSEINFKTSPLTTPGAPTIGVATAGNAQATVIFAAPASDGGSPITGYTATSSPGGLTGTGTANPIIVLGLTNGTAYTFTVTATNANGTGPASSASNSVTPSASLTTPGAPTGVSATTGYEKATVTFTAPVNNGGSSITGYTVTSSPGGFTGNGTSSPITVTGLPALIAYTFTVTATNAIGTGPASSASNSVTPTTVPGAPTIGAATSGSTQATVAFTAPANDGGSAILGYTVTSSPGSITGTGTSSPITVTGLTNGTACTFTVVATNINGNSAPSAASNSVTPSTVPGAPTGVTATTLYSQAIVTFTAPESNGGSPITGYTVTSNPDGITRNGSSSPITITGLTYYTAYTFTVVATNINGNSASSSASNSVIPGTVTNPATGKIWMDRNLGATSVAVTSTYANAYGHLYQWGRGTDGHQVRTSGTTTTLSTSNTPGHGNFILAPNSPYDWRSPQNTNLWQGVSGENNPCPTGYRLPTEAEWNAERLSWSSNNAAGAFASPLKLTVAGNRDLWDGSLYNVGTSGGCWSSTVSGTNSRFMSFSSNDAGIYNFYRAYGSSVRCIKN
jgi:hypothetical protein